MLDASREAFAAQTNAIRQQLLSGTALQSGETGLRVGKKNWWLWVFHHEDSVETGRRRAISALDAIRLTLAGKPLPIAA